MAAWESPAERQNKMQNVDNFMCIRYFKKAQVTDSQSDIFLLNNKYLIIKML